VKFILGLTKRYYTWKIMNAKMFFTSSSDTEHSVQIEDIVYTPRCSVCILHMMS